ncbi:MAG: molybdopterin-dependent oxidoreductase, partial [Nitrospira sp.]|nr:molybdopterin-dependent oxidoreductase [Nitrospira sp.]
MSNITQINRRTFLVSTAFAAGGLVLGFHLPMGSRSAKAGTNEEIEINAWLRIGTDDSITIQVNHSEMGQGSVTGLPMILADELEADWTKVKTEFAPSDVKVYANPTYGDQVTGGSSAIRGMFLPLRKVGAAAKEMLMTAAAQEWGVSAEECEARNSIVTHKPTGRTLSYGALAKAAAKIEPPKEPKLKSPDQFRLINKSTNRLDAPAKVDGSAKFGIDVTVPGMLVAT